MKTLIQLIGAQPLPNLLPWLHLKPDQTMLIYTPQTDQVRRRIESVIGQCRSICCDAYDIESLVKALDKELVLDHTGLIGYSFFHTTLVE